MISKQNAADRLKQVGIIAIIRGDYSEKQLLGITETLEQGGIPTLEVTLNSADALRHIATIRSRFPDVLVGAGTVRDAGETRAARAAGAQFLVSPNYDPESIAESTRSQVLHLPGVFTASEAQEAFSQGCRMVKLFPSALLGPGYLKALRAPLDRIEFIPTGGITPENLAEYVEAGAVAVGVGSSLVGKPGQDLAELGARAKAFTSALSSARGGNEPATARGGNGS